MDQKHVKLSVIGFAILLIGLVGVTYSFFNYTRTGSANNIRTGRIYFNTTHGDALNLTNVFPMTSSEANNANLDSVIVGIMGDTTYADGEEFEITLVDVTNTINGKQVPINYIATYTSATGGSIGTPNSDYWEDREAKDANIYKLNATGEVVDGKQVLTGYIKNGTTGISGTLTIKAYIDADRTAISDTYYSSNPGTDNMGTTSEWVKGRTIFTTTEWNSLSTNGISFKIKAESNEGIWVIPQIDSCIGCVYMFSENEVNTTWNNAGWDNVNKVRIPLAPTVLTSADYDTNYLNVVEEHGRVFIGVKLNSSNQITNIYSCGVLYNTPFCLEGDIDGSKYKEKQELVQKLWNNTCTVEKYDVGMPDEYDETFCDYISEDRILSSVYDYGEAFVRIRNSNINNICFAENYGDAYCIVRNP